jgi:hypothetical protein
MEKGSKWIPKKKVAPVHTEYERGTDTVKITWQKGALVPEYSIVVSYQIIIRNKSGSWL